MSTGSMKGYQQIKTRESLAAQGFRELSTLSTHLIGNSKLTLYFSNSI